jgi:hypothetical protein
LLKRGFLSHLMTWPEYFRWLILFAVAAAGFFYLFAGMSAIRERAVLCDVITDIYLKLPASDRRRLAGEFDQAAECLN